MVFLVIIAPVRTYACRLYGTGNVGAKLAGNLLRYRHTVEVHDASREAANRLIAAGASWAETPRLMAERCDALITCLPFPAVRSCHAN